MPSLKIHMSSSTMFLCLFLLVYCNFCLQNVDANPMETRIINMSLYLGNFPNETINELLDWLEQVKYEKWTFVLQPWFNGTHCNAFFNTTFTDKLKQYGELTPALPFGIQNYPPEIRKEIVDDLFEHWKNYIGYEPKGFFQFQPDTCTCNYILEKGCEYWQGYCFDGYYTANWMDMRGGWQMPYYASIEHALIPKQNGIGIVILPHNTWDWRASVEHNHQFNTHLLSALDVFSDNWMSAREYLLDLINRTVDCVTPFGYAAIQHEWLWMRQLERLNELENYTLAVMELPCIFQTFNETANWFKQNYPDQPDYYVNFVTPYDEKKVEWLWNKNFRVTRYDEQYVVGYVNYTLLNVDPYVDTTANCNFLSKQNETNNIRTSLEFLIDDYGNAIWRAPPKGNRIDFKGTLKNLPSYFTLLQTDETPPNIYYLFQQPPSGSVSSNQQVKVSVKIVDLESGVKNASLYYSLNNSTEQRIVEMSYNQSSGFYEALISPQVGNTNVKYRIVAYDNAQNKAEENNNGHFFAYSVLSQFAPSSILFLLAIFLCVSALIIYISYRRRGSTQIVKNIISMPRRRLVSIETLVFIIFFLLSLRVILWLEFPRIIVAGDLRPPLNLEAFTRHALYVWNEIDFGTTSVYLPRILDPFNFLITSAGTLGFDMYTSQILSLVVMYFLLSALMYAYVKMLADGDRILAFTATLFLNFNLFLINDREQTAVGFISVALMVLPSLVMFTYALRKNSSKLAIFSGMLFILTQGTFPNYRPFLLGLFANSLTALYFIISKGVRISFPKTTAKGLLFDVSITKRPIFDYLKLTVIYLIATVLSLTWIIVVIATNVVALLSASSRMTTPLYALNLQLQDVFRLIAHWAFYEQYVGHPYIPYANSYLHDPVIIFLTFLIPIIAFASLLIKPKLKILGLYFAGIGLISLFLTSGFTRYFKDIYYSLTTNVPLLIAFRTSTHWIFFVILSYSVLLGAFVSNVCRRFKSKWPKLLTLGLMALLFVSVSFPLVTGDVTRNWLDPRVKGSVFPKSFVELDNMLSDRYWTLLVPKRDVYVIYNYSSGTLGCGNPYPFIFSKPFVSGVGTEYLESTNLDVIDKLHEMVMLKNDTIRNIAPRGEISASSSQDSEYTPNKANDQSNGTRWSSQLGVPQWLAIEWTEPQELEGVRIFFETAYAQAYLVQTWNDTTWIDQANIENNNSTDCTHIFPENVTTKKVRLYFTESSIWKSISIWEVEVYRKIYPPSFSSRGLGIFGVGYLILEKDIIMGAEYNITEARARLEEKQDIILLQEWEESVLYRNIYSVEKLYVADTISLCENWSDVYNYLTDTPWNTLNHSIFVDKPLLNGQENESMTLPEDFTWKEISPCKYAASLESKGPFFVVLLESYDTQWKLQVNGEAISESCHFKVNAFGNGWFVNETGNLSLEIKFEPQDFVVPSMIFSFLLPLILIAKDQIEKLVKSLFRSVGRLRHVVSR